jgi:hypothetical protein
LVRGNSGPLKYTSANRNFGQYFNNMIYFSVRFWPGSLVRKKHHFYLVFSNKSFQLINVITFDTSQSDPIKRWALYIAQLFTRDGFD